MATNRQVARMKKTVASWQLDIDRIMDDQGDALARVLDWASTVNADSPLMIYSTSAPEEVAAAQKRHGAERVAKAVESFLATAAEKLVAQMGVTRLVVAGGETAGAVVKKLGIRALQIGPEICPGVPWTQTAVGPHLALALKSGNFGADDFFEQALRMLP